MTRASLTVTLATWCLGVVVSVTGRGGLAQSPPAPRAPSSAQLDAAMFAPSSDCLGCHNNLVGTGGEDVSIGASWRGSMMANAALDPYVIASVRRESLDHPSRAGHIEDDCATCHAPTAQKMARAAGLPASFFSHLSATARTPADDLARDGVTCTVCHQIAAERLGTPESFNGNFVVAPPTAQGRRRAFGQLNPDAGRRRIMHSVTGFEQEEASHIRDSELCATCHTLITEAFGPDGAVTGSLPEQMNYHEWRHSAFFDEKRSCQSCHMPTAQGPVRVASVLGDYRDTLSRHTFVGGNAFMLRLLNRYRHELGVTATSAELDATARATVRQLENDTATVAIDQAIVAEGALAFDVLVRNLTGHKFPTGYPSRRAWLHVTVRDAAGGVLFESGRVTDTGLIVGNDNDSGTEAFEPHHLQITSPQEVQIYESIMGTPGGRPTTGLLQATQYLKDNRLLPRGFDKQTAARDIAVLGAAATDPDFTGNGDRVQYRVAVRNPATVEVELKYQPIAYRWAQNLGGYDANEPRAFLNYFNSLASFSSVAVARASRDVAATGRSHNSQP